MSILSGFGATPRDAAWQAVEQAINQGLPQTAIERLEPIIAAALAEEAWAEAVKAIARKTALEGTIQGNKPEEKILRLKAQIAKAPPPIVPLLDTLLANWYWHYFQQNRWRFLQRTATATAPGEDFTTWDLPRLFAEIDRQFTQALSAEAQLKAIPIADYDALLVKGTLPDSYRPTLYDFIAHEALEFYTAGEQVGAQPQDAFEIAADSPIFAEADEFLAWQPLTTQTNAPALKAVELYQRLLRFHRDDDDPSAFLDADLARLLWAKNVAFGDTKTARFKEALKAWTERWADHPLSALALYHWARVLQEEGDLVEAHALAIRGRQAHPESPSGRWCANLVAEIESKSVRLHTERVWNAPWPKLEVRYRNLTNVWFRAVAWDWDEILERRRSRPDRLNDRERRAILAKTPTLEWSHALPATPDYKERLELVPAPDNLPPGFYFLIASHRADFAEDDNQLSMTDIWVSDLALILRPRAGQLEGFVLDAASGEPVAGATVEAWYPDRNGTRVRVPPLRTDELGFFSFRGDTGQRGYLLKVSKEGQALAAAEEPRWYGPPRYERREQTIFFTDRALYRPGQIVQYKGICVGIDPAADNYEPLAGREVTVVFKDPNGKEIARQRQRCNDYGSFAGSFNTPSDRVTGRMLLTVEAGPPGTAWVSVEEYKRPKFQVTLDAPTTAPRLDDTVTVTGRAASYTGAAIDGAEVRWRVVREVRFPPWWGWFRNWQSWRGSESQEIAHGVGRTEPDGSFRIEFTAKPDASVPEEDEPTFVFSVYADVTDTAGETRSAQRGVNVGYTALRLDAAADDWQTPGAPVEVRLTTRTLDGEPQAAEGTVKVYRLQQPETVQRPPIGENSDYRRLGSGELPDRSDPNNWALSDVAIEQTFTTDAGGATTNRFELPVGAYRLVAESQDRFGRKVTARLALRVVDPAADRLAIKVPQLVAAPRWSLEPGEEFRALWGTGYEQGRAFIEIEHRHRMIQRFWTPPGRTQQQIVQAVTEAMRGGFTLHVTQVRENRAYLASRRVDVPWSNKELEVTWEHFTSKLEPNQKETWTAVVSSRNPKPESRTAERIVAEMAATLYDASLDQFLRHAWLRGFSFFRQDQTTARPRFQNGSRWFEHVFGSWQGVHYDVALRYREFPPDLKANVWGYGWRFARGGAMEQMAMPAAAAPTAGRELAMSDRAGEAQVKLGTALADAPESGAYFAKGGVAGQAAAGTAPAPAPDLSQITARRNLNETAFFFPQLTSDTHGVVRLTFTMPEALTEWRFLGFAHDRQLRSGFLEGTAVTAKDIMVQPHPPRFLREGDTLEFTVKVLNQSPARQTGRVKLSFAFASNGAPADEALALRPAGASGESPAAASTEIAFDIPAKESRSFAWRLTVPDGCGFLTYKAVGSTGRLSDGEEGYLPVLARRVLVTESLPLPIRGPATKQFEFTRLLKSGASETLVHQSLTLQMVSNPAWYAVMALPYLMEFPHECTEQTFNRFYANALARHLANADPKIRRLFDQWKATPGLDSPLEKNPQLKSVMLEETPWLRQAQNESQARKNLGVLFDDNRLDYEIGRTLRKLTEAQLEDGSWPWFAGGRGNDYITLYITTGFGRLRHLGVDVSVDAALRSLQRLDHWMQEHYARIQKWPQPADYVPSATDALYLYGRSFFLKDRPIAAEHRQAIDFFLGQARKHWLKVEHRQSQGHLALALHRFNSFDSLNGSTAKAILRSLKERSVTDEELGRFWRDTELSWWWYRAPIETQALMIEAFDEVLGDAPTVEECRVWLLKQKQTQDWKTTKATADAVYALLLRGHDLLASDRWVELTVGGIEVTPGAEQIQDGKSEGRNLPEAGTGFYERRFAGPDIKPELGHITVKKTDEGIAWGSVHWQYLEDLSQVTSYEDTPLKLKKALYTKVNTASGPVLQPLAGPVRVGDELVVRLELRVDRDLEYVHLKDHRGSGTEPVNVLSGWRYQDGLAYYESTRDTASHFFIDYLPKGTYVFEYATRVQHRGEYQTGVASIQCMYAPEFNSHSQSVLLVVE